MSDDAAAELRIRVNHHIQFLKIAETFLSKGYVLPHAVVGEHFGFVPEFLPCGGMQDFVTEEMLKSMGMSFSVACDRAIANMIAEMGDEAAWDRIGVEDGVPQFYVSNWSSVNHAAGIFNRSFANLPCKGTTILFPISKDKLIVTGSESAVGLAAVVAEWEQNPYLLPPFGLVYNDGVLSVWEPPITNLAYTSLQKHKNLYLNSLYGEQCNAMRANLPDADLYFPAKFMLAQTADGTLLSRGTVTQGVQSTSLPVADFVHFIAMDPGGMNGREVAYAPWAAVQDLLADSIEVEEKFYPKRFLLRGFPEETLLQKMSRPQ